MIVYKLKEEATLYPIYWICPRWHFKPSIFRDRSCVKLGSFSASWNVFVFFIYIYVLPLAAKILNVFIGFLFRYKCDVSSSIPWLLLWNCSTIECNNVNLFRLRLCLTTSINWSNILYRASAYVYTVREKMAENGLKERDSAHITTENKHVFFTSSI